MDGWIGFSLGHLQLAPNPGPSYFIKQDAVSLL